MLRTKLARSLSSSAAVKAGVPLSRFDDKTINYEQMAANIDIVKGRLGRPLTLSEKVSSWEFSNLSRKVRKN